MPSRNSSNTEDRWVRPLGACERLFAYGGYLGSFNTLQAVWIESEKPFNTKTVMQAAQLWYTRTAILQVSVRRRFTTLWFRQVSKKQNIDFQVVEEDPEVVLDTVHNGTYDMKNGPLWRVRFVLLPRAESSASNSPSEDQSSQCRSFNSHIPLCGSSSGNVKQIKKQTYRAVFVLGVQHAITDAATNFVLANDYVKTLNRIVTGNVVKLKKFSTETFTADALRSSSVRLWLKFLFSRLLWRFFTNFGNRKITFGGKMPIPTKHEDMPSKCVKSGLDEATTQNLIRKCQQENTTVHSCVITAANIAYLDMINSETLNFFDKLNIYYINCVNVRRYYSDNMKQNLGCHISYQEQTATVTSIDKEKFWYIARESCKELHDHLKSEQPLDIIRHLPMAGLQFAVNFLMKKSSLFSDITDFHYTTSNMGEISHYFPKSKTSEQIKIVDIFRCATADVATTLFTLVFHTFRKRLYISCDYYTNKIGEKQMRKFLDGTVTTLQELCAEEYRNEQKI